MVKRTPALTTAEMELVISRYFRPRVNIVVPNVSWGMNVRYECDLVVLNQTGYAHEVEIKISRNDLINDLKKKHHHDHHDFRSLWFAVPTHLLKYIEFIPRRAGILAVTSKRRVHVLAKPEINHAARKYTDADRYKLARLGYLRIWTLKQKIFENNAKKWDTNKKKNV